MPVTITAARPDSADATLLINELEDHLSARYPAESRHGLSVAQLLAQGVAFFILYADGAPAGCGGIKLFGDEYGELKRMYVRPQFRGHGYARMLINHLEEHARAHGVNCVRLETGIYQTEAIGLYERAGYKSIGRFGDYPDDRNSLFYEKQIA
jgi:putative acetyltransferase